jgi:hypothetical protein
MTDNLIIQFKKPQLSHLTNYQKELIVNKANKIFSIEYKKIKFSEYKKGSAFIPKKNEIQL